MLVKKTSLLLMLTFLSTPIFVGCLANKNLVSGLQSGESFQAEPGGSGNRQASFEQPIQSTSVEPTWHEYYQDAQRESAATGKPILADFTGSDWCPPCMALKKNVFETQEFKSWASENVVLLELDFPKHKPQPQPIRVQNQQLAQQLGIDAYPTVIFLSPEGERLGKLGFAPNASQWLAQAEATLR